MSLVVSDTTPLNYLFLTGHVDILQRLFGTVIVPPAVLRELQHPKTPSKVAAWASQIPSWLEVRTPKTNLHLGIGAGEDEAIALAIDLGGVPILMDDRRARAAAQARKIPFFGTLAILDLADEGGLLVFEDALRQLQATSFHIDPATADALLRRVRARRSS